jgi:hypothetical protein
MTLLAVRISLVAVVVGVLAGTSAVSAAPSFTPSKAKCPAASLVGGALGLKLKGPTTQPFAYAKICLYKGSGAVPLRITFQQDTAATFAAGQRNAAALGSVVQVKGIGKSAYGVKSGGFLGVYIGGESIRITAPLVPLSKLEVLARKLV